MCSTNRRSSATLTQLVTHNARRLNRFLLSNREMHFIAHQYCKPERQRQLCTSAQCSARGHTTSAQRAASAGKAPLHCRQPNSTIQQTLVLNTQTSHCAHEANCQLRLNNSRGWPVSFRRYTSEHYCCCRLLLFCWVWWTRWTVLTRQLLANRGRASICCWATATKTWDKYSRLYMYVTGDTHYMRATRRHMFW